MKYLVTGAAGFIGSHIVDALLARGHKVTGYDNLSTGNLNFLNKALNHENFDLIKADILDAQQLKLACEDVDAIYHLAANADIRGGLHDPYRDLEQNTYGTFRVLEAMRQSSVRKIVFASSAAALGEPSQFPTPESCSIPNQTSLYGVSKMAGEGLISAYCQGYGFEGYIFRFVSILGPRYPHGHVFDFVKQLLVDKNRLVILGDGTQRKSYLHVSDCIRALMNICEDTEVAKNIKHNYQDYHLGFPDYCMVSQSVAWIIDELQLSPKIEYVGGDRGWIGDNPFVFLDVSKALSTGWRPEHSIEASIRETARWLFENQWIFTSRV